MDKEFTEVIELLRSKDADAVKQKISADNRLLEFVDTSGRMLIHWAASTGCLPIVEYILSTNEELVTKLDDLEWSPFMIAVSAGHLNVVKCLLLSHYININHRYF